MVTTQTWIVMKIDHRATQATLRNRGYETGIIESEPFQGQPAAKKASQLPVNGCNGNLDNITTVLS